MTTPTGAQPATQEWYARPGVILSMLGILVLLTALLVKTPTDGRAGDPRLTTTSTSALGAKLFYELAERLGYRTQREKNPTIPNDSAAILAVLDPPVRLTAAEVHNMLQHVRAGGALLTVLGSGTAALSDSLKITIDDIGTPVETRVGYARPCKTGSQFVRNGLWFGPATLFALHGVDSIQTPHQSFLYVRGLMRRGDLLTPRSAMVGFEYGAGRIVVASDPDVLRNDALRNCSYALDVVAVEALTYLRAGAPANRSRLVFDEFHQNRVQATNVSSLMVQYLTTVPSGQTIFQICVAGLILMLATATRVLPPREDRRIERRSPLEHVDALARAYAQVGATRTGTLRLVRGLQRRVGGTKRMATTHNDEEFLSRVGATKPALAADVRLVQNALTKAVSKSQFQEVGSAIARIEASFTQT